MITKSVPHLGLIPLYVDYFEQLDPRLRQRKEEFASRLEAELSKKARVTSSGLISTVPEAAQTAKRFSHLPVDVLVIVPTIAVFGQLSFTACTQSDLALLLVHPSDKRTISDGYSMTEMVTDSGGLGLQALCNTLMRFGRKFVVQVGPLEDPSFLETVMDNARALAVPQYLRRSRAALIGSVFEYMTDIVCDTEELERHLGLYCTHLSAEQWKEAYRQVSPSAVAELLHDLQARFTVAAISDEELNRSVRLALALDHLVSEHQIHFGALNSHGSNCLEDEEVGIMASLGVSLLTSRGIPFSEVGDLPTAIAMTIGKLLGGSAVYAELDAVDYERDSWFIANSGELDLNAVSHRHPVHLRGNANFKGRHGRGASFEAVLREGPATLLSFTPTRGSRVPYRLIAARGEIDNRRFEDFHSVHALLKVGSGRLDFQAWCEAGAVHHSALIQGDIVPLLKTLCRVWDPVELVCVN